MTKKQKLFLAGVIVLAIFFRFYQIAQMPGGLFPDEAANGLDVNLMQQGHLQPFYERGNGREALFFYLLWGSVSVFGKGPWQHHMVSAAIGVLSVLMCFLVTKRLFLLDNSTDDESLKNHRAINIALLSSFLMAVSTWHVVLSRTAFRAILIPLFSSLAFYFILRTFQAKILKSRLFFSFLFGASFALGFYTYIAYRILVPILGVLILWPILASLKTSDFKNQVKKFLASVLLFLVVFTIFIYPLAKYFYQHPGSFVGRAGQVSVFNPELYIIDGVQLYGKPPLGAVLQVAVKVAETQLAGFFAHGDLNWRQNISGQPFLSPLVSPFFGVGLIMITVLALLYILFPAKRQKFWKYTLLAGWFWGMLLPVTATAEGIPHGLRGVGVIPSVFIISAWILYEFGKLIVKFHRKIWEYALHYYRSYQDITERHPISLQMRVVNLGFKLVVVGFVVALILQSYFLYFVYAANSPENFYYFRSDLTVVSKYLVDRCQKNETFLVLDKFSIQTTDYLTSDWQGNFQSPCNVPYQQVDPENSWQLSNLKSGDEIVFTQSSVFDTKKFKQYHPEAYLFKEVRNKFGQTVMAVYRVQ
jgi:hypothetical protein